MLTLPIDAFLRFCKNCQKAFTPPDDNPTEKHCRKCRKHKEHFDKDIRHQDTYNIGIENEKGKVVV